MDRAKSNYGLDGLIMLDQNFFGVTWKKSVTIT